MTPGSTYTYTYTTSANFQAKTNLNMTNYTYTATYGTAPTLLAGNFPNIVSIQTMRDVPGSGPSTLNISFVNRTPSDITTTALFTANATFTYQYNTTGLIVPFIGYYLNSSLFACTFIINGTCQRQNGTEYTVTGSNTTVNNTFSVGENSIYPSIQNTNTTIAASNVINLTNSNQYFADIYQNMSTGLSYGFYEYQINGTGTVSIYYINSSYDFNSNPATSQNAHLLCNADASAVNHSHSANNWDNLCAFTVNSSGFIDTVKATSTGGFLIRGTTGGVLLYGYAGAARTNVSRLTTNSGTSWTSSNVTIRTHLHQFATTDSLCFAGKGNYTSGSNPQTNGTTCDTLEITAEPPTVPNIYTPNQSNYTRFINITYEASSPTVPNSVISYYNITLRNNDSTFNLTIYTNNSLNTSFNWNTYSQNLSVNTPYRIRVTAYENNSLSSYAESDPFTVLTNGLLNVTARTRANATINNLTTFTVSNTSAGYSTTVNASQNGSALVDIIKGYNYLIEVNAAGYALQNTTSGNITTNSTIFYAYLYRMQTLDIRFYDETTNVLLNGTAVSMELISNTSSYNYTTTNGTLFVDLLTPDTYTMRYGADNYSIRFYSITITSQSFNALNLTLCPDTTCSAVTLQVKDQFDNSLEGAIIKVLKYDVLTNSYVLQETLTTNFEGQVQSQLQVNNEYYKFIIEYDGAVVLSTLPTYIYGTTVTFVVNIGTSGFEQYFNATQMTGYITKVSDAVYSFTWNDEDNTITQGCLYAYTVDRYGRTAYNSTCTGTSTGTVFITIDNASTDTYELEGRANKGGTDYVLDTLFVGFDEEIPTTGDVGMFIMFLVLVAICFVGLWNPTIAVILAGTVPFLFILIGFVSLSITTGIAILILSFIVAYILNK